MGLFKTLKNTFITSAPSFDASLDTDRPVAVVGDVHGRLDLLETLLDQVPETHQLIFVGDLIDRGEQSAEVLVRVQSLCDTGAACIMGNHEKMLLDFLDDPVKRGGRWLRFGGLQTVQSFGLSGINERADADQLQALHTSLMSAMPEGLEAWLRALPLYLLNGNLAVVHAGADPALPVSMQDANALLWGHGDFDNTVRDDETWIIHGHTIVDTPTKSDGKINVDTGAYATGRLTAALITGNNVDFIST